VLRLIASFMMICMLTSCGPCAPIVAHWEGEAELAKAQGSKRVQIEDARGKLESAKLLADAEIERARGVAEANKIIGNSLKDNESYLRYLYLTNLEHAESKGTVIYVPTEAGLPIMEAGKRPDAGSR
jgi:regulator of protease activity HflC (stomatin/prohibitin superfamily)